MANISHPFPQTWKIPWHLVLIFSLLAAGILALGYFFYDYQVTYLQNSKAEELSAIADLKVKQIVAWRRSHLNDALLIFDDPILANQINNWFAGRGSKEEGDNIRERLEEVNHGSYVGTVLFDSQERVRLSFWEVKPEHLHVVGKIAAQAMCTGKIILTDLYFVRQPNEINMSLAVPILLTQKGKKTAIAAVVYQIDPDYSLYPLLHSGFMASKTGEMVLARRDAQNNGIIILNELRQHEGAPLVVREPLTAIQNPSVKAALGEEGVVRGVDYHHQSVLAVNRRIPDSPWFLTAKIDLTEVTAPLRRWSYLIPILTLTMMASAGLGAALLWRHRDAQFYREQYQSEAERLSLSLRYEYLTKYAYDIILLTDKEGKIIEANERAVDSYGYSRHELLNLPLSALVPTHHFVTRFGELKPEPQDGFQLEAINHRKDGSTFPAEISSSLLEMGDKRIYQYIIRDISDRKSKEKALQDSERQLRFLSSQLLIIQENERWRIAKELHDELGQVLMVLKFQISSIQSRLTSRQKTLKNECEDLLQYLDNSIENVRRLSHDLSPSALGQFGLAAALKNLLENFSKRFKVQWEPRYIEGLDNLFSPLPQINIYRIFQESLTNIGRHSQATDIAIGIEKPDGYVTFVIEDNGKGFDPQAVMNREPGQDGIGLVTMQERARLAGGRLEIKSRPGAGTRLTLTIPVEEARNG
jgi:PAS domain S-box-containing protein